MNPKMLHVTDMLRKRKKDLDSIIAILNLPRPFFCARQGRKVIDTSGKIDVSCKGCIAGKDAYAKAPLAIDKIKDAIDYFKANYGTIITTVTGKGDPFHPNVVDDTLGIVRHSAKMGIVPYVFTAGDHLDDRVIGTLADAGANIMISLLGNPFIDAGFFAGKAYPRMNKPGFVDPYTIAANIRKLIKAYRRVPTPAGTSRIGFNYVIKPADLADATKVKGLRDAITDAGLFLICNPYFGHDIDAATTKALRAMAKAYSHFGLTHSTGFDGRCHVGAGSSCTIDYDGRLLRCPHLTTSGDGDFFSLRASGALDGVLKGYMKDRKYSCTVRKAVMGS